MARSDLPHEWQKIPCCQSNRHPSALGGGPQPVDGAIAEPGLLMWLLKREAQTKHPRSLFPAVEQGAALRAIEGKISQDRQAIGMFVGGFNRHLIGVRVPARRMDHGGIDAGRIHLLEQIILGEGGDLSMARIRWDAARPDVHLRVNNQHDGLLLGALAVVVFYTSPLHLRVEHAKQRDQAAADASGADSLSAPYFPPDYWRPGSRSNAAR